MTWFGDFFAVMFGTICNKLDMHEPLIQNIFVYISTQDVSAEITVHMNHRLLPVYMNDFFCEVLAL